VKTTDQRAIGIGMALHANARFDFAHRRQQPVPGAPGLNLEVKNARDGFFESKA